LQHYPKFKEENHMKKINRPMRALAAAALAFTVALSGLMPVWATDSNGNALSEGTGSTNNAQAAITKVLKMPEGTDVPTGAEFTFTAVNTAAPKDSTAPDLGEDGEITITLGADGDSPHQRTLSAVDRIKTVLAESGDILPATPATAFDKTGMYVYEITETGADYSSVTDATVDQKDSKAMYTLTLYVEKDSANGDALYIRFVAANQKTDDEGGNMGNGDKTDPTPGGGDNDEDGFSDITFTNIFVKTNDGKPGDGEDPDPEAEGANATLAIVKETSEESGGSRDLYFPFEVTVTAPEYAKLFNQVYYAYVATWDAMANQNAGGYVVVDYTDSPDAGLTVPNTVFTDKNDLHYYKFVSEQPQKITLRHGQSLIFTRTPVGTSWTATETLEDDAKYAEYTSQAIVKEDGKAIDKPIVGAAGQNLPIGNWLVGEAANGNGATFENHKDTILPMGLDINNLPYYGLILLALLALAAYVAIRARRRTRSGDVYN
jgi:hypothetical protein